MNSKAEVFKKLCDFETPQENLYDLHNDVTKGNYTSDTKFCSEIKKTLQGDTAHQQVDPRLTSEIELEGRLQRRDIGLTVKKKVHNDSSEMLVLDNIESEDSGSSSEVQRNLKFDVFADQSMSSHDIPVREQDEREYTYFDMKRKRTPQSSRNSSSSQAISEAKPLDQDIPDSNRYISPNNESGRKDHNAKRLFDYDSSRHSKSFDYSDRNCPATPNKRVTRNSKNPDLISPVTRILGIDSTSSKVNLAILCS